MFKKLLALTMVLLMVLPLSISVLAADKKDETLEKVILKAKSVFDISDDYTEFNYSIDTMNNTEIYNLSWSYRTKSNINVAIDKDCFVFSYSSDRDHEKYSDHSSQKDSVPSITKVEAIQKAYDFVLNVNPNFKNAISIDHAKISHNYYNYVINFDCYFNNKPIHQNNIDVFMDYSTGEVISYDAYSVAKNVLSPANETMLPTEEIITAFNNNLPFELNYKTIYRTNDYTNASVKLSYEMNNNYYLSAIDAITGEKISIKYNNNYNEYPQNAPRDSISMDQKEGTAYENLNVLTEHEINAIDIQKKLITEDDVKTIISDMKEFNLSDFDIKSSSITYSKSIYTKGITYYISVSVLEANGNKSYIKLNAETGEVISFNKNMIVNDYKDASELKYSDEDCKLAATEFLQKYYPEKYSQLKYDENYYNFRPIPANNDSIKTNGLYNYQFTRYINDIKFTDNFYITVDADTLEISSFNQTWSNANFPKPKNLISAEKALSNYFDIIPLKAVYIPTTSFADGKATISRNSVDPKTLKVVYMYSETCSVNPVTGDLQSHNGTKYTYEPQTYFSQDIFDDIKTSSAKSKIEVLVDMDIINSKGSYKPNKDITEAEFVEMLQNITINYFYNNYDVSTSKKNFLTRENAAKLIVDYIGYNKIADLSNIFKCDFKDANKISENIIGYVAIANGLGILDDIVKDNNFNPTKNLTRAEAAVMIYDYIINN